MGSLSIWHWIIVIGLIALLFGGAGRLSGLMGDAAKGIRAFRDGLKNDGEETPPQPAQAAQQPAEPQPLPQPTAARENEAAR